MGIDQIIEFRKEVSRTLPSLKETQEQIIEVLEIIKILGFTLRYTDDLIQVDDWVSSMDFLSDYKETEKNLANEFISDCKKFSVFFEPVEKKISIFAVAEGIQLISFGTEQRDRLELLLLYLL